MQGLEVPIRQVKKGHMPVGPVRLGSKLDEGSHSFLSSNNAGGQTLCKN